MSDNYLNKILNKLLDVGKRNQLINFKNKVTSSCEFYFEDFYSFFEEFKSGEKFAIAKLFSNLDETITHDLITQGDYEDKYNVRDVVTNALGKMIERKDKYEFFEIEEIKNRFSPKKNTNYLYPLSLYSVAQRTLLNLKRKARIFKEENGIDTLYIAFGLFEYEADNTRYFAPVSFIPVNITKNHRDEIFIEASDDDFLINENFIQYVKLNFNLKLSPKNSDLKEYIENLRRELEGVNIRILERVAISLFSFGKIAMFNDINENFDKVNESPLVNLFKEDVVNNIHSKNEKLIPYIVVPADKSQREAIDKALSGDSFVLEGPPGTGKSQTITNMISSLIGNNKKVLFVCEKQSALDIVYKNLVSSNLSCYALPIYDNKANKKEVVKNIFDNIENKNKLSTTLNSKALDLEKKYSEANEFFDKYNHLLNETTNIGKTIYEILNDSLSSPVFNNFKYNNILSLDKSSYYDLVKSSTILEKSLESINYNPKGHPYFGFTKSKISDSELNSLISTINKFCITLEKICKEYKNIDQNLVPPSIYEMTSFIELLSLIKNDFALENKDFNHYNLEEDLSALCQIIDLYKKSNELKDYLMSHYKEIIFDIDYESDLKDLKEKYNSPIKRIMGYSKIFNKYKDLYTGRELDYKTLVYDLEKLEEFYKVYEKTSEIDARLKTEYPKYYFSTKTDFDKLISLLEYLINFNKRIEETKLNKKMIVDLIVRNNLNYESQASNLKSYYLSIQKNLEEILTYFEPMSLNLTLFDLLTKLKTIVYEKDSIYSYLEFLKDTKDIDKDIKKLIYSDSNLTNFSLKFIASINKLYLEEYINSNNEFDSYTNASFEKFSNDFVLLTKDIFEIAKINIADNITSTWPNLNSIDENNLEVSILRKEVLKKRKLMSLRTLFSQISNLIQTLKPVIITSPLFVSQYLDSNKFHFDTVIFDEASQLTEENTIGSIYRADQMIIVGDKEQLAPTSFFDSSHEDEDDDYLVFSSVLDKASSKLENIMLKWHYRSKYESLINFSNKNIYKDLYTFPSSTPDKENGLQYIDANAIYTKNYCINEGEARKVVDTLFDLIERTENKSIGIVTFNMSQENLIYKMVERRRKENKNYEDFFNEEKEEPFFVKNLETVQGDERDIIILSTTFGPDQDGKQSSNFGPINKEGGYKRLNVAITRAKERLVVISSVDTSLVSLKSLNNKGVSMFINFLNYAKNKESIAQKSNDTSYYLNYVKTYLENKGLFVDTYIGDNKFKIDLAIKSDDKYVGAIILENGNNLFNENYDNYYNLRNILLKRGFEVFYLFLTPNINQINTKLDNIYNSVSKIDTKIEQKIEISEEQDLKTYKEENTIDVATLFEVYPNIVDIIKNETNNNLDLESTIFNILSRVSPIKQSEFVNILKSELNLEELDISNVLNSLKAKKKIYIIVKFILTKDNVISPTFRRCEASASYNRKIDEYYIEELEAGFLEVIRFVKTTSKGILFSTFNTLIGYAKESKVTIDTFNRVLSNLSDKGEISLDNDIINLM